MENQRTIFLMQQTSATLFSLANKLQVKGDQYLKHLTSRQMMTMIAIIHLPEGDATLNKIAKKLGTTKQSANQLVSLMEKKGYVSVVPHLRDKRAVNVSITPAGNRALAETYEPGMRFFHALFHEFTPEEMETLWSLLKKLYRFDGQEQDGFEEEVNYNPFEKKG
jgi:DNA-binding MarR family transcriptional regulator